ncbi:MAG TPA: sodium:solute symporter family protein [Acidobacteriota bacterium]|nr:sodium:solute symporter family protein [Acidobacteriota bacterium]
MLDLLIVMGFVAYAVTAGFRSRAKASQNLNEYFLAGRTVPGWQAGTSMAATQFAADTPLLVTGLIATGGIFELWRLWIYGLAFLMMAFILSVAWRRAGVLTDAELTEVRYSGRGVLTLRVLKAVYYGTVINCVVMAMVLVAAVRIAEVFLPWHLWLPDGFYEMLTSMTQWSGISLGDSVSGLTPEIATTNNLFSILVILGFTALYSTTGGLRSVIATDVMQFILAMLGTLVYAWVVISHAGGLWGLTEKLVDVYGQAHASQMLSFAPGVEAALMPFLVIVGLQWFFQMNSDGTGYLAQRSMACRSDRDAKQAGVIFAWLQIFARSLIWLAIGLGLLVLYPFETSQIGSDGFAASREILFVTGINDHLPMGIRGLMLTGLLAALASTIDTHLNWGASYWSNDIYDRFICRHWKDRQPQSHELVLVARLSNLLILVISLIIMANLGSIQQAWQISLLFGAGIGSVLVLRWLWERVNLYSELAAIAVSLLVAPLLLVVTEQEYMRLGLMALISTSAVVFTAYALPHTSDVVLKNFYKRVDPPGFWRRTSEMMGEDPSRPVRRLWKGVRTTGLCGLSLFLCLVGAGKLLLPAPGESILWGLPPLLIGVALIPTWIREVTQLQE